MSTYIFVSGKNWTLSLAELGTYFQTRNLKFKIDYFSTEFCKLTVESPLNTKIINDLGGTIKIAQIKTMVPTKIFKEAFLERHKPAQKQLSQTIASSEVLEGILCAPDKVLFGISIYTSDNTIKPLGGRIQRFIGSAIKDELAVRGKKSRFMGIGQDRSEAQLSHVEVLKKNLVENQAEVLFCMGKTHTWIANTIAVHNPFEFQKRDLYKPNQRAIFGMSPRLARIMVNFSGCMQGKVLLDAFCGVGTILQEALLEQASVVGMDVNPWCVKAAKENLEWLTDEYSLGGTDFRVLQGDVARLAEKMGVESVDCVVSEPDLGPALREIPTGPYAQRIIAKLEPLFFEFIEEAYRVLRSGGRLVVVTPLIRTRSREAVVMALDEKLKEVGFKRVYAFTDDMFGLAAPEHGRLMGTASFGEIDEHHKIGREIHILQK
ncbi:MAG: methyltransferase domain-containing protein [Nitrososphaerota archaeon]|jgi:tRNA G10  N-methylase Trm11|nr:methyltransferase domain-containing protein [Nitrososphaerota archaeon]